MKIIGTLLLLTLLMTALSCNKTPAQAHSTHYHLKGKIVSIDDRAKMVNVDSESIPGFMDAMIMPYKVKPDSELNKLHAGDAISADLLVEDDGAWLEDITVINHSPAAQNK